MVELGIKNSLYNARLRHPIESQLVAICINISSLKSNFVTVIHKLFFTAKFLRYNKKKLSDKAPSPSSKSSIQRSQ